LGDGGGNANWCMDYTIYVEKTAQASRTPIETLTGCSAPNCTTAMGMGPNGGDLLTFTIDPFEHPVMDDFEQAGLCFAGTPGLELIVELATMGYTQFTVDTCGPGVGLDTSVAVFDGDPTATGMLVPNACSEDVALMMNPPQLCSQVGSTGNATMPPTPVALPASSSIFVVVDEFSSGNYWNGATTRTFQVELIP